MIAITGSRTGFLNSHIAAHLPRCDFINRYTRRDPLMLLEWIEKAQPTCVIHTAGQTDVRASLHSPILAYQGNTVDTITLLNVLDGKDIPLIYIATDKVFGDRENCDQFTPYKPLTPYDASKVAAEVIVSDYAKRNRVKIVRFPNFYGPGDPNTQRLIPGVVQAIREKHPVFKVRTNLRSIRQYIFILDAVQAILEAVRQEFLDSGGCVYHVAPPDSIKSVADVITDLCDVLGNKMEIVEEGLGGEASKLSLAPVGELMLPSDFVPWRKSLECFKYPSS